MRDYQFFVYIMASKSRVLYTGFTNDLRVRVLQHKTGRFEGFTRRYRAHRLVYFESYRYVRNAIAREKEIKRWVRQRRVALIESINPRWEDLAAQWFTQEELNCEQLAPIRVKFDPSVIQTFTKVEKGQFTAKRVDPAQQEVIPKVRRRPIRRPRANAENT